MRPRTRRCWRRPKAWRSACARVILGLNPSAIAVDDFAATGWDLIQDRVWQVVQSRVPEAWRRGVEIFPSSHATHSSLRGATALVVAQFFTSFASEPGGGRGPIQMR